MIPNFHSYCQEIARDMVSQAFLSFLFEGSPEDVEKELDQILQSDVTYRLPSALGFLSPVSGKYQDAFASSIQRLAGRTFDPRKAFLNDEIALLGCYWGLKVVSKYNSSAWFHELLRKKRGIGRHHAAFCDALEGKYSPSNPESAALFLFLRQKEAAVTIIDPILRDFLLEHWKKPFPYYEDFFRNVLTVKVLHDGLETVLNALEKASAKIRLSQADVLDLESAMESVEKGLMDSAIEKLGEIIGRYERADLKEEWSILKSRWERFRTEKDVKGTISEGEARTRENSLIVGFIQFINQVKGTF